MKRFNSFSLIFATLTLVGTLLWSCQEKANIPSPGDNSFNLTTEPAPIVDAIDVSIDSALLIIDNLNDGETTTEKYRIRGIVSKNITSPTDIPSKYTDINIVIKDGGRELTCYYTKNLKNKNFTSKLKVPLVDSDITLVGPLQKYVDKSGNVKPEMVNGFIETYHSSVFLPDPMDLPICPAPLADQISIFQADSIGKALGTGKTSKETYKIVGIVYTITEAPSSYKNATFTIIDQSTPELSFYCYRVKAKGTSAVFSNPNMLAVGDTVFIESKITNYNGTIETVSNQGNIYWSSNKNLGFPSYEEVSK